MKIAIVNGRKVWVSDDTVTEAPVQVEAPKTEEPKTKAKKTPANKARKGVENK